MNKLFMAKEIMVNNIIVIKLTMTNLIVVK
jgi:hypothetical protein